jgi:preprotein translocase subunit SecD
MTTDGGGGCLERLIALIAPWMLTLVALFSRGMDMPDAVQSAPPAAPPNMEMILVSSVSGVTPQQWEAASAVIHRRMDILIAGGQISAGAQVEVDKTVGQIHVAAAAETMNVMELATVLTRQGFVELVDFSQVDAADFPLYLDTHIVTSARVGTAVPDGEQVYPTVITHADIVGARAVPDDNTPGGWQVWLELTDEGAQRLARFTRDHIGSGMALAVDGIVLLIPVINAEIGSPIVISASQGEVEAHTLAAQIGGGALPISLVVSSYGEM